MTHLATDGAAAEEPDISVILPVFNEAAVLGATIASIRSGAVHFEVIVVDAQSSDETSAIASAAGARVISCAKRQRAYQLNLGARQARGAILLFVHADTLLPSGGLDCIAEESRDREVVGGGFARRYASPSLLLRATCALARWRNQLIGWHLGDQAMFVRRAVFFQLGGFREVDVFEDVDFSRRLKQLGRVVTLLPGVTSSARRFARSGAAWTTLRDFGLTLRYLFVGLKKAQPGASAVVSGVGDPAGSKRTPAPPGSSTPATTAFSPVYHVAKSTGKI